MNEKPRFQFGLGPAAIAVALIAVVLGAARVDVWLAVGVAGVIFGLTANCFNGNASVAMFCLGLDLIAVAVWRFTIVIAR